MAWPEEPTAGAGQHTAFPAESAAFPAEQAAGAGQRGARAGEQAAGDAAETTSAKVPPAGRSAFGPSRPAAQALPPEGDIVLVVPGRRRFHVSGCTHLTGRLTEELTVNEAVEEGFSPCTSCLPDAAPDPWATGRDAPATFTAAIPLPPPPAWVQTVAVPPAWGSAPSGEGRDARTAPDEAASPPPALSGTAPPGTAPSESADGATAGAADPTATVWVVRGVSRHHLHDCVLIHVVGEEDVDTMTLAEAEAMDCTPCKACHID